MELNRLAPDFELRGLDGRLHRLRDCRGKIVIVNFWSCDCPHVVRTDKAMLAALKRWSADVVLLTIASNVNESLSALEEASRSRGIPTVLIDAGHIVADSYAAEVTPEVFIVDRAGILRYRGAVDDVTFRQRTITHSYLEEAVETLLAGSLPSVAESPAYGCSIIRES
jgi:thiol-disulfide isomerase/thioredoxin